MTQTSYPFDGTATSETQYSQLFRELQSTGVAASADSLALKVSADAGGMRVFVQPGFAIVRGHAYNSTAVEQLTIATSGVLPRTDRVVLRLDPTANSIVLAVLTGAAGGAAPALTQTDTGVYELLLADVTVGASVTNIGPGAVLDRRSFTREGIGVWTDINKPSSPRLGQLGFNTTTASFEFYDGTWKSIVQAVPWGNLTGVPTEFPPSSHSHTRIDAAGTQAITTGGVAAGDYTAAVTVTLPAGRFSSAPVITLTPNSGPGGSVNIVPRAVNITATSFQIILANTGSTTAAFTSLVIGWHATPAG